MVYFDALDIKELRMKLGLTQERMAQELGVSFKTVNRWEKGRAKPSAMARKLLNELGRRDTQ
jgi:putative transcriptional regulator